MSVLKSKTLYFLMLVYLFTTACEADFVGTLEDNFEGEKITINGFISPDSIWLQIGKSVSPYKGSFKIGEFFLRDAQVFIVGENGQELPIYSKDGYNYTESQVRLSPLQYYRVKVISSTLGEVVTEKILIPDITTIYNIKQQDKSDFFEPATRVSFTFYDALGNHFYITQFAAKKDTIIKNGIYELDNIFLAETCIKRPAFSDQCFDGKSLELDYIFINTYQSLDATREAAKVKADSVVIRFGQISEELYVYMKKNLSYDDTIIEINQAPISYSNVPNGYGLVFGQNWKEYVFKLE